jgi:hypothetical protein
MKFLVVKGLGAEPRPQISKVVYATFLVKGKNFRLISACNKGRF